MNITLAGGHDVEVDEQLLQALAVVQELTTWLEVRSLTSDYVACLSYTPYTLSIEIIGDRECSVWNDQCDGSDTMTFEACLDRWIAHCCNLARYIPKGKQSNA